MLNDFSHDAECDIGEDEDLFYNTYEECDISCTDNSSLGDINNDLVINVLDVIEVINLIIDNEYNYIVDMNHDLDVNVLDIIELVNIILNNN